MEGINAENRLLTDSSVGSTAAEKLLSNEA